MPIEITPQPDSTLTLPVKNLIKGPPVFAPSSATVAQAAHTMQSANVGSVLIATEPTGIVTDRDLRGRVLAQGLGPGTPITQIMSRPLKTIDSDAPAFTALCLMLDENIHHLPVVEEGKVIGVISSSDLLLSQARNPLYLRRTLATLSQPIHAASYGEEIGSTIDALFQSGLGAAQIGQIISSLNDVLVKRLVELAQIHLGTPPAPFAWIVFGSEGRLEQALLTDQDNALVYDDASSDISGYFEELSRLVVDGLIQAGFPRCLGGFMATNWCKTLREWRGLFANWIALPKPAALLDATIFFDFRVVAGALSLEPLEQIITGAQNEKLFHSHLLNGALAFHPPLGFFNWLRSENGNVDLKKGGIGPIVGLARAAALAAGSRGRSTLERLRVAAAAGTVLSSASAQDLAEIFPFLLRLRLCAQLAARKNHQIPTNNVNLTEISMLERRHLKEAFIVIKEIQEELRAQWRLDQLG